MTSFRKKLLLILFVLFTAVTVGVGFLFAPQKPSASVIDDEACFNIDENGVFNGLTAETENSLASAKTDFTIKLPATVTEIGVGNAKTVTGDPTANLLFRGAAQYLTGITFDAPANITKIGYRAFVNCTNLSDIDLSGMTSLNAIEGGAFRGCTALNSMTVPSGVTALSNEMFRGCSSLTAVEFKGAIEAIPARTFQNCTSLGNFEIPASVTAIGEYAFSGCTSFTEFTVPAAIKSIGLNAFQGLSGVTKINYYAADATNVYARPFAMSDSAYASSQGVEVRLGNEANAVTSLPANLFDGHKAITQVYFDNVKIQSGAQDFGTNVFANCTSLEKVEFDGACNISVINTATFSGCINLYSVKGLENANFKTIGANAFNGCRSLYSVTVGSGVTQINEKAFFGCTKLIEVKNLSALSITAGAENVNGDVARYAKYVYGASGQSRIDTVDDFVFYADTTTVDGVWLMGYHGNAQLLVLPQTYTKNSAEFTYNLYESAFIENKTITRATMSVGPKKIGSSAFAGCTSLNEVRLPNDLQEMGANAFQDCTSLKLVQFFNNSQLSIIPDYAFSGCTALEEISIPAGVRSINIYAFSGCANLTKVTFKTDNITKISGHAFDGCSSLSAVKLPAAVNTVEVSAFENCANLKFVYLPEDADYKTDAFKNCHEDLLLISANASSYASDKQKSNLSSFVTDGKLTYIVNINLVYPDTCVGGVHGNALQKLYNLSGALVQDKSTLLWTEGGMPVQGGHDNIQDYEISKWFDKDYENEIDVDALTEMLKEEDVGEITLYAKYYAHPALTAKGPVDFDGSKHYSVNEILTELLELNGNAVTDEKAQELVNTFDIEVISRKFANGSEDDSWFWQAGKVVSDAGTYTLSVSLPKDGSLGKWENSFTVEFTISAVEVDITYALIWRGLYPDLNETKTLYFYDTDTPSLEEINGQTPIKQFDRKNSYTVYTGKDITITLDWIDPIHSYGTIGSCTGITAKSAGTYTATAIVTPSDNYSFTFGKDSATLTDLIPYGIAFSENDDGSVSITKTWYIALSKVNQLLSGAAGGGLYNIPSEWVYGDGSSVPQKPVTSMHTDRTDILKFTFKFTDFDGNSYDFGEIFKFPEGRISISDYGKYFNPSMPAGDYEVVFYIDESADGDPAGSKFSFTVQPAIVTGTSVTQYTGMISGGDVEFENDSSELRFRGANAVEAINSAYPQRIPGSNYIWAGLLDYYKFFEIRYCFVQGNNPQHGDYLTEEEIMRAGSDVVKPSAIGSYTVYYKIQAPNYATEITGSYILNITHTLRPVIHSYDFDGKSILNSVVSELKRQLGSEYFDIYTALDYSNLSDDDLLKTETARAPENLLAEYGDKFDDYTAVGTHYIFLKIKESYTSYIRWNGTDSADYFVISIKINVSANALVVNEWQYGRFTSLNVPKFNVSFGAGTQYCFKLYVDGKVQYVYYSDKTMNDAIPADHTFKAAPVGEYKLVASAYIDGDDDKKCDFETTINVLKVKIDFAETPYLSGWTYGQITSDTDLSGRIKGAITLGADIDISVKGDIVLKFIEASKYPNGTETAKLPADARGFVPSGDYYVVLTRAADGTYEELSYPVRFSVLPAVNHWNKAPEDSVVSNISIKKDAENSLFNLFTTYFGTADDMKIEIKQKNGTEWRNVVDTSFPYAGVTGNLNVGEYEMRITVGGSDIVGLQETISLTVTNAAVPPEGNQGGTEDGNGSGGISDTVVFGAIIAFAAITVIVIIAGAIMLSVKKKKANAEFIKTVKSEMKRR